MEEKPSVPQLVADVQTLLREREQRRKPVSEVHLSEDIAELLRKHNHTLADAPVEVKAEYFAFRVMHSQSSEDEHWGVHFRPCGVIPQSDGSRVVDPSLENLDVEFIQHWQDRGKKSEHSVLRARYCDLVWDLKKLVCDESPSVSWARIAIDSYVAAAYDQLFNRDILTVEALSRGLSLALSIGDDERKANVRQALIKLGERGKDDSPGVWTAPFDRLFGERKKCGLTKIEEGAIVKDLEDRLDRSLAPDSRMDLSAAESASTKLASYYRVRGQTDNVARVLRKWGSRVISACEQMRPLMAMITLDRLYKSYAEFGLSDDRDEAGRRIEEVKAEAAANAKRIESSVEIPSSEFEQGMQDLTKGKPDEFLEKIAVNFLALKQESELMVAEIFRKAPLFSLTKLRLHDQEGNPRAEIGSVFDDPEGRLVRQMAQIQSVNGAFARMAIERLTTEKRIDKDMVSAYLMKSPVFVASREDFLRIGVAAYFDERWCEAIHVLVPQIEAAVRELARRNGAATYRPGRYGTVELKQLDALLREPVVVGILGDDIVLHLRALLTDRRGLNLRNDVSHALVRPELMRPDIATLVLHALLILSQVKGQSPPESCSESS